MQQMPTPWWHDYCPAEAAMKVEEESFTSPRNLICLTIMIRGFDVREKIVPLLMQRKLLPKMHQEILQFPCECRLPIYVHYRLWQRHRQAYIALLRELYPGALYSFEAV